MVAVDLLARLTSLLDDKEALVSLDDALDLLELVARDDDEAVALRGDPIVVRRSQLHVLEAGGLAALAVEGDRRRQLVALRALLDPLVDAAEDLLVSRGSFGEPHRAIIASTASARRDAGAVERLTRRRGEPSPRQTRFGGESFGDSLRNRTPRRVGMATDSGRGRGGIGGIGIGGILVIVGIIVAIVWSLWLGIIIALIGLIAFGGFAKGRW